MGKKKRQKEQINIYASNKKNKWKHRQSLCLQRFGAIFRWPLTSSEMSSLLGKFWLTAAREACSMSRIHLLMLSIDESHSRWPGALSLQTGEEKKGTRKTKMSNEERKRPEEEMLTLELLKHRHIAGFLSPPPLPLSLLASSSHWCSGHICQTVACRVSSLHREIKSGSKISFEAFDLSVAPASWAD